MTSDPSPAASVPVRAGAPSVVAIHLSPGPRSRSVQQSVERAVAITERGIEGDRNARHGGDRQVLLVEHEVLESLELEPGAIREQITVRGLALDALAPGTRIRVGTVSLAIAGPCDPCQRMEEIRPGLMRQLEGRRGRFARVIEGGTFAVGDALVVEAGR